MDLTKILGAVCVTIGALVFTACSPADTPPPAETPQSAPRPPARVIANAGNDRSVFLGTRIILNGNKSTNSNQTGLTYAWTLDKKPVGSQATLNRPTAVDPTFTVDVDGTYEVTLIVADVQNPDTKSAPDSITVFASGTNPRPVANIQTTPLIDPTKPIFIGSVIAFNGSQSSDENDPPDRLKFRWTLTQKPDNSNSSLRDATTVASSFTPDAEGLYKVTLVVNDGKINSKPESISIIAKINQLPMAIIDVSNSKGNKCDTVTVDGTMSNDPEAKTEGDNGVGSYLWTVKKSDDTDVSVNNPDSATPSFTADQVGTYTIKLTVTDRAVPPNRGIEKSETITIPNTTGSAIHKTDGLPSIRRCSLCHETGPGPSLIGISVVDLSNAVLGLPLVDGKPNPPSGMDGPTTQSDPELTNNMTELKNYLDSTQKSCSTNPI